MRQRPSVLTRVAPSSLGTPAALHQPRLGYMYVEKRGKGSSQLRKYWPPPVPAPAVYLSVSHIYLLRAIAARSELFQHTLRAMLHVTFPSRPPPPPGAALYG